METTTNTENSIKIIQDADEINTGGANLFFHSSDNSIIIRKMSM